LLILEKHGHSDCPTETIWLLMTLKYGMNRSYSFQKYDPRARPDPSRWA
jgi:hypothetical protein